MSETTATRPARQRKPRPKAERFASICPVGDVAVLVLREKRTRKADLLDTYTLEVFPSDIGGRGVELTKPDGTRYHVNLHGRASACDCPGMEHHGWHPGPDGEPTACKHISSLLALETAGRL